MPKFQRDFLINFRRKTKGSIERGADELFRLSLFGEQDSVVWLALDATGECEWTRDTFRKAAAILLAEASKVLE